MWETKIGRSIQRHFTVQEDEDRVDFTCRRCGQTLTFSALTPLIYLLGETIHHLQATHAFTLPGHSRPGTTWSWTGYLDALPAPPGPVTHGC